MKQFFANAALISFGIFTFTFLLAILLEDISLPDGLSTFLYVVLMVSPIITIISLLMTKINEK